MEHPIIDVNLEAFSKVSHCYAAFDLHIITWHVECMHGCDIGYAIVLATVPLYCLGMFGSHATYETVCLHATTPKTS